MSDKVPASDIAALALGILALWAFTSYRNAQTELTQTRVKLEALEKASLQFCR